MNSNFRKTLSSNTLNEIASARKTECKADLDDIQGLLRFGHGRLSESRFLLLTITDATSARDWLQQAPVTTAQGENPRPETALQLAFSAQGLRALGLNEQVIQGFSDEFIAGMSGDESRSRRLGDTGSNAPNQWLWGGSNQAMPHVLMLLYSTTGRLQEAAKMMDDDSFQRGFTLMQELPTGKLVAKEPFGFVDGISQPRIAWGQEHSTDVHENDHFSNWTALGEFLLGYRNEYGLYTPRPLIDPLQVSDVNSLPDAEDQPTLKDFARNGSYLVIRQLQQDVKGFWRYVDEQSGGKAAQREQLASRMVGRKRDGTPLAARSPRRIAGINPGDADNHFSYDLDSNGEHCPIGAHIRRSNPRTGDYPAGVDGFCSRMLRLFGFGQQRDDEDLIASTRFHRLLRRGRSYGLSLSPTQALKADAPESERGLEFICLVANISRQFEFVQNAWNMHSKFAGLHNERDPIVGIREPLNEGSETDGFRSPETSGVSREYRQLPEFVSVLGGGYFFMPGIKALRYLASAASHED